MPEAAAGAAFRNKVNFIPILIAPNEHYEITFKSLNGLKGGANLIILKKDV